MPLPRSEIADRKSREALNDSDDEEHAAQAKDDFLVTVVVVVMVARMRSRTKGIPVGPRAALFFW
jgi:hypothetical protein